ncbi:MAG: phosphoribosyltransferase [Chitinophagales bacterium]|nr:phosphoribosyltransferase [Bacteroidota bacterium]MBP7400476.1 phosphoribosyltransferase [Chitinophagales bacterium]
MNDSYTLIFTKEQMQQKIKRIAYQIAEDNYDEDEIIIAGIGRNSEGYALAFKIYDALEHIIPGKIRLSHIDVNKNNPSESPAKISLSKEDVQDKVIVLVDDVSNSGRTLIHAIKPFLELAPHKIQIAVLVERTHKKFPIQPDFVGLSLSTTLQEHITVIISKEGEEGIYLS